MSVFTSSSSFKEHCCFQIRTVAFRIYKKILGYVCLSKFHYPRKWSHLSYIASFQWWYFSIVKIVRHFCLIIIIMLLLSFFVLFKLYYYIMFSSEFFLCIGRVSFSYFGSPVGSPVWSLFTFIVVLAIPFEIQREIQNSNLQFFEMEAFITWETVLNILRHVKFLLDNPVIIFESEKVKNFSRVCLSKRNIFVLIDFFLRCAVL
jgi:hypothetical protein